jgi:hypothetical protein
MRYIMLQANTVVKLPTSKSQARPVTKRAAKALRRQTATAHLVGGVAVALTALSLHDLAEGVRIVTHSATWQSYAMASGIDLGFISTELAMLTATDKERKSMARFANPAIIGTLCGSAVMNAFAFVKDADGLVMAAAAIAMGVAIPALIYAFTRIGADRWISAHNKA